MEIGKPDESLGRKATGPVKWQPAASQRNLSLGDLLRFSGCCFAECIAEQHLFSFSNFFPKEERHAKLNILGKAVERLRRIHLPDACSGNARTRSFQGR